MKTFKNKVVVITGSTQGIGKRTAEILAQNGAKIIINSRNQKNVEYVVEEFSQKGYEIHGSFGDISDFDYCLTLRNYAIERFGKIDFLINNAGVAVSGSLETTESSIFESASRINILGSIYPTKVFLDDLVKSKGGILFISSLAGIIGLPNYSIYSYNKRSIVSFAESMKNELYEKGVFVGVNYPGFTENDVKKKMIKPDGSEIILQKRINVKVDSLDKTVLSIIYQLKKRKFRSFSSTNGKLVYFLSRFSPKFSLYIIRLNRKKIMQMD
jgi:short-subunit dehydrogenase